MTSPSLRSLVLHALGSIAPEADLAQLDPRADMRDALDLDSMDVLRLARSLHEQLDIEIPESDYGEIASLQGCISYLERRGARPKQLEA